MGGNEIRRWIGLYMLGLASFLGVYILLLGDTWVLPLEKHDKTSAFEIIVPFLLAQLTIVFSYYGEAAPSEDITLPPFIVKGPLLAVAFVLAATILFMAVGGYTASKGTPTGETFKAIVTFIVALMNASTVFVIGRVFAARNTRSGDRSRPVRKSNE